MGETRWLAIGARWLSILCWLVIVAVTIRVLSGGGTLVGVGFVLSTESPLVLASLAATFISAVTGMVHIIRDRTGSWSSAWKLALFALTGAAGLLLGGHESALFAIAAAGLALAIALAMTRRAR